MRDTTSAPKPLDTGASWLTSSLHVARRAVACCVRHERQHAEGNRSGQAGTRGSVEAMCKAHKRAGWTCRAGAHPQSASPQAARAHPLGTHLPVLLTDAATVSTSQGARVRRSITSQLMPSFSATSFACSDRAAAQAA